MIETAREKRFLWVTAVLLLLITNRSTPTFAQTAAPDSLVLTIQEAKISKDGSEDITVFSSGTSVDVVNNIGGVFGSSAANTIPTGEYKVLRLTVNAISWRATWSSANPSPCDGATTGTNPTTPVDLGGHTDFYFKTPDLGGNTLAYYQTDPNIPDSSKSEYVGDDKHPFILASPIKVAANATTTVNLIFGIGNTLTCNGISVFNHPVNPGNNNFSPLRTMSGTATGLSNPIGIYVDTANSEIGVANSGNDSITSYDRFTPGNVSPLRMVHGTNTGLSMPTGIYVDLINSEIGVANSGNDSITIYDRSTNGNVFPKRLPISGYFTGLSKPMGIYVDTTNNEIGIANSGNNSITIYNRLDSQDVSPLRTIRRDFVVTSANNVINLTETGGVGDANAAIAVDAYKTGTDLAAAIDAALEAATAPGTNFDVTYDNTTGLFTIKVTALDVGVTSVTLNWNSTATTAGDVLGFNPVNSGALVPGPNINSKSNFGNQTGLSNPCGIYVDTSNNEIGVANSGNSSITIYNRTDSGNVTPLRIITGSLTGLSNPCGIYVDTSNNEIGVANSGNSSITIYNRTDSGNVTPLRIITGSLTGLHSPAGLYVDTVNDEIGVVHRGQEVLMASLPFIFPAGTNASSSSSPLSGNYNLIFYGAEIDHITPTGITIPRFFAERGRGNISFDPNAMPTSSFIFNLDTRITRRLGDADCFPDSASSITGTYGINSDGSFYMLAQGDHGTLQGTVLADGSVFVASMYDSPNKLMVVYGVRAASQPPLMTSDGTSDGLPIDYLFASYRMGYDYKQDFDPMIPQKRQLDLLKYQVAVGIAETGAPSALTTPVGVSGDANLVQILNSTGLFADPTSAGPTYRAGFSAVSLPPQNYVSDATTFGFLTNPSDGLAGALTEDGATLIFMRNTNGCDDLGFDVGLRASRAGSFGAASLTGSYFTAAFGDLYDSLSKTSLIHSTGGTLIFDKPGHATLTLFENADGLLVPSNQSDFTYRVRPRFVPSDISGVQPSVLVDVIDLFAPDSPDPVASALIGPGGRSLIFYKNMFLESTGTANSVRLLGLALRQTVP